MGKIRRIDKKIFLSFILSLFVFLIMLMGMNMEVLEDAWYIESSVDGLFGKDNIELAVLCSHPLLTGLIYLLSKTGLRIFWFNIILIIGIMISNIIIIYLFTKKIYGKKWVISSLLFLIAVMSMTLYQLIFTVVGTYVVITGTFCISYGIEEKRKKYILIGLLWMLFGIAIRIDCLYFGIAYFGIYQVSIMVIELVREKFSIAETLRKNSYRIIVSIIVALVSGIMGWSYSLFLNYNNPGFIEWNRVRSSVMDYEMPDYHEYEEDYLNIGVSENDYYLLNTWNNFDPDFFTTDRYKDLEKLRLSVLNKNVKNNLFEYMFSGIKILRTNMVYWICLVLFFFMFIQAEKIQKFHLLLILSLMLSLTTFFYIKGRLTIHIQHSILISTLIFLEYFHIQANEKDSINWKIYSFIFIISLCYKSECSASPLLPQYMSQLKSKESLVSTIHEKKYSDYTYNSEVSDVISNDKDHFYYTLLSPIWLQNYPLHVVNPFITDDVEACSNLGFLTSYIPYLNISKRNCSSYDIVNPIKDLVNENVRIVVRKEEINISVEPIKKYIQEHYYKTCKYDIEREVGNCVIIRFSQAEQIENDIT